jgi:hypothetical protein
MLSKTLAVAVIILFLGLIVHPSIGFSNNDDTTPPVTTHSLDPSEPTGANGWYVSDVNVTLTATDDESGVNVTYYRLDGGEWIVYTEPFTLSEDGDDVLIEYYSVDYADNVEDVKSFIVDIDQTEPGIGLFDEVINNGHGWEFIIGAVATDYISGMEKVEFYVNLELQGTVYGPGPEYEWLYIYPGKTNQPFKVRGFIRNLVVTEDNVSFYAYIIRVTGFPLVHNSFMVCGYDKAGNWQCDQYIGSSSYDSKTSIIYSLRNLTFQNDYRGFIGKYFIFATFNP